ncbi:MAG: hypothetical protein EZS28_018142 [Streblomastix strix]|uniref:Uncharacterized protein n=1 Tax=Streblomastix strix TaxID=222440 RepID=A0A5J4VUG0_9EUKA|nr:MAG: hypothetical protein EZS28_018142 [Streblomastix strix]
MYFLPRFDEIKIANASPAQNLEKPKDYARRIAEIFRQEYNVLDFAMKLDINALDNSANGDFAFSAQSGTVWMYETNWYDSGQLVPDQVTPASDANPLIDYDTGVAGISTNYSRGDHQHPLNVSDDKPKIDVNLGAVGTADSYARSDHQHILNTDTTANKPVKDSGVGNQGDLDYYARSNHSHPLNVDSDTSKVPLVNATAAANGTSDFYCRNDLVHPEQLSYNGNLTATSFIKTGGTANEMLLANGTTKPVVLATRADYISIPEQFIKLCTFNPTLQNNCISVEFTVRGRSGFGLLQFHILTSTGSGLNSCYYHLIPNFQNCMQEAYALYFGTGTTKTCELWLRLPVWSNTVVIDYTNSSTLTSPITNILNSAPVEALPTDYSSMVTMIPNPQLNNTTINNAPFTQNDVFQVNPIGNNYNEGIRIAKAPNQSSQIFFGVDPAQQTGAIAGQWTIGIMLNGGATSQQFSICQSSDYANANR